MVIFQCSGFFLSLFHFYSIVLCYACIPSFSIFSLGFIHGKPGNIRIFFLISDIQVWRIQALKSNSIVNKIYIFFYFCLTSLDFSPARELFSRVQFMKKCLYISGCFLWGGKGGSGSLKYWMRKKIVVKKQNNVNVANYNIKKLINHKFF